MRIRKKRTLQFLAIAVVPAVFVSFVYRHSMSKTARDLADHTRQLLVRNAEQYLQTVVSDFGRLANRDKSAVELALARQAQEVRQRLAGGPSANPRICLSEDYDTEAGRPSDMRIVPQYRKVIDNVEQPVPVSFSEQVFVPVEGVDRSLMEADMGRLSTMPEVYGELYQTHPDLFLWLYTSLEVGFHSCYPGHGGYPPRYDPRVRDWYTRARQADGLVWTPMPDVSTRKVNLTASIRVNRPDGSFAGVTAIDVPLRRMIATINLPDEWRAQAIILHVSPQPPGLARRLLIIADESYIAQGRQWQEEVKWKYLESDSTDQFEAMVRDILNGRGGVRRMDFDGKDAFCAYGQWKVGFPLAVVIVPYARVVAEADETEQYVLSEITSSLKAVGVVMGGVLVVVFAVAVISSRSMTRPVSQLADAAKALAAGDFSARVDIRSRDELGELGDVFNGMGPRLLERQEMKRSLELASEIQHRLLPQGPPDVEGFDIAGRTFYCDETGGDYYDFIDLAGVRPNSLGIALGDVTGHGVAAALLMAAARSLLRSRARGYVARLGDLMGDVNEHLVADTDSGRFMTLFYGELDTKARTLCWASAGHDPGMWFRATGGEIEQLRTTGIVLGVLEGADYEDDGPVALEAGDVILIGTDGIWEAKSPDGEEFGKDRLERLVRAHTGDTADQIIQTIRDAVAEFCRTTDQKDDITMVVIKAL